MNTKKHPFRSVVRRLRLLGVVAAVLAPMASRSEVAETDRIDVTAKTVWAQATTVEKLPAASDWGYKYSFGYYNPDSSKDDSLWGRQSFVVPDEWADDRLRLDFTAIDSDMIVFVNGRRVAELPQPRGWVDVTGFAHAGTNELMFFTSRTYVSMSRTIDTDPIRREGALPDTDTTGFWTEIRTNLGRPLMWYTGPDFRMNAGWKPKEQRRIPDFAAQKRQQTGGWHRITVDIPLQADLNARMEVVYPDGSSEKGESDYDYKPGTVSFCWMPIFNQKASRARMFLDDITVTAISRDETEGE